MSPKGLAAGIRVAVIAAMRQELQPIVKRFELRPEALGSGRAWRGRASSREVVAVATSMGTTAATHCTTRLLDTQAVDHVMVVGIAGAIASELRIGDLLNPEAVVDERTGAVLHPTPLGVGAPRGRLLTTDTLHNSLEALEMLRRQSFLAVDMETAAIGAVAEARGLPWSVFRAISDFAGDPTLDEGVVGLVRADGTPDPGAVARFVLTRPWRIPQLVTLGRGAQRAVRVSTNALITALGGDAGARGRSP